MSLVRRTLVLRYIVITSIITYRNIVNRGDTYLCILILFVILFISIYLWEVEVKGKKGAQLTS